MSQYLMQMTFLPCILYSDFKLSITKSGPSVVSSNDKYNNKIGNRSCVVCVSSVLTYIKNKMVSWKVNR